MNSFLAVLRILVVMRIAVLALLAAATAPQVASAQARRLTPVENSSGRRLALVIGNAKYQRLPLQNPLNDARAIAAELESTGFEVTLETDVVRAQFLGSVGAFVQKIAPGDTALFYYSGHGMAIDGINFLIPVDLTARTEFDVKTNAIPFQMVREEIEKRRPNLRILILDACRDNPFVFARSGSAGLARMAAGAGTIIAFAAEEGQTADDNRAESNGIFTKFLLDGLRTPGLKLRDLFDQVQRRVYDSTGGRQTPAIYSSVVPDFYFRQPLPAPEPKPAPVIKQPEPEPPKIDIRQETITWESVMIQNKRESYELYLKRYPNGLFSEIARERIKAMTPAATPPPPVTTAPKPEPAAPVKPPAAKMTTLGLTPEITRAHYRAYALDRKVGVPPAPLARGLNGQMTLVTWKDAQNFCAAVNGRLPSEQELIAAQVPGGVLWLWTSTEVVAKQPSAIALLAGQRRIFPQTGDAFVGFRCIIPIQ